MFADRLRLWALGTPFSGKTGMLHVMLGAGFDVGVLCFDDNPEPLLIYTTPAEWEHLSIISLHDNMAPNASGHWTYQEEPIAFRRANDALKDWGKADSSRPWGPVRKWGPQRILVLDNLTGLTDACLAIQRFLNPKGIGPAEWGDAQRDQDSFISQLASNTYKCHLVITAHLKIIGPRDIMVSALDRQRAPDLVRAREAIALARAEVMPTKLYPTAVGDVLARDILRRLGHAVLVYRDENGNRWITSKPPADMPLDIGAAVKGLPDRLPQETGLLDIMKAVCGYDKPPAEEEKT